MHASSFINTHDKKVLTCVKLTRRDNERYADKLIRRKYSFMILLCRDIFIWGYKRCEVLCVQDGWNWYTVSSDYIYIYIYIYIYKFISYVENYI